MRWGEVSPGHRERFLPGSLRPAGTVSLNLRHKPLQTVAWSPGGGLHLAATDRGFEIAATAPETPAGNAALQGVRDRSLRGLSVEFHAIRERRDSRGVREIEDAVLAGVGLVPEPSYPSARPEVRQAPGDAVLRGALPLDESVSCRCGAGDRIGCQTVRIAADAFDDVLAEVAAGTRGVSVFVTGAYEAPFASTLGGGLAVQVEGGALAWSVTGLPDTSAARDLLAGLESAPELFRTRAYWPAGPDAGEVAERIGDEWRVSRADLRGIEIAPIAGPFAGLVPVRLTRREARGAAVRRLPWL